MAVTIPATVATEVSAERRAMVQSFVDLIEPSKDEVVSAWNQHASLLKQAHGIFVVADEKYNRSELPGDSKFGEAAVLRSWLSSRQLLFIQGSEDAKPPRYGASIF